MFSYSISKEKTLRLFQKTSNKAYIFPNIYNFQQSLNVKDIQKKKQIWKYGGHLHQTNMPDITFNQIDMSSPEKKGKREKEEDIFPGTSCGCVDNIMGCHGENLATACGWIKAIYALLLLHPIYYWAIKLVSS